ncbi:MAG: hypothetical protein D6766_05510 [Verrucomicrobia bacterium]|nr:MAG: hypothetical protein D6766_05510 [Verrucomicrobiota bacterium]
MNALSWLAKVFAFVLWPHGAGWAVLLWALGLAADFWPVRAAQGGVGAGIRERWRQVLWLNLGAWILGLAAWRACDYAAMRWKDGLPGLAGMAAFLLHGAGLPVSSFEGDLFLTTMAGPLRFSVSADNLWLWLPATGLAVGAAGLFLRAGTLKAAWSRVGWLALLLAAVAVVQFVLWVSLFLALCDYVGYETEELPISPLVGPLAHAALYLPLMLAARPLLGRILRPSPAVAPVKVRQPRWRLAVALPAMAVLWLVAFWEPQGTPKQGRLVISTFHTEWSPTSRPYDRNWYGADSGYNYAVLKRWFGLFKEVREVKTRLTRADLEGASVLMIYLPNVPLGEEERNLVLEFVRNGGGLLVIGDHTNVFGSTSHLNPICEPFGFFFRDDVLFDLDADFFQLIDLPRRSTPFTHGMTFFKFRGPASIQPTSLFTRTVLTVGHAKSLRAIYSVNNFYPPPHDDPKMKTGLFAVSVASRFGSGRVLAFADSTIFSNFEIFYPGKYEYLLNALNWLNHRDSPLGAMVRRCALLAALGLLVYLLAASSSPRRWLATVAGALVTAWVAGWVVRLAEDWRAGYPEPVAPGRVLFFATPADEPAYGLRTFTTDAPYEQRFDVFVQWVLRTGAFSAFLLMDEDARTDLYDHLRRAEGIEPAMAFIVRRPEDLDTLRQLAGRRGREVNRWLVMFSRQIQADAAVPVLKETGLLSSEAEARARAAWTAGQAVIDTGQRRLVVVSAAERFSDQAMGFTEKVVPTPAQRALFDRAFALVDTVFGLESGAGSGAVPQPATSAVVAPAPSRPNLGNVTP